MERVSKRNARTQHLSWFPWAKELTKKNNAKLDFCIIERIPLLKILVRNKELFEWEIWLWVHFVEFSAKGWKWKSPSGSDLFSVHAFLPWLHISISMEFKTTSPPTHPNPIFIKLITESNTNSSHPLTLLPLPIPWSSHLGSTC